MKRILSVLLLTLLSFAAFSQSVIYRSGPANTVGDYNLFAIRNFRPPVFADTTAANLMALSGLRLDSAGAIINTLNNKMWKRNRNPLRWEEIGAAPPVLFDSIKIRRDSIFIFTRDTVYYIGEMQPFDSTHLSRRIDQKVDSVTFNRANAYGIDTVKYWVNGTSHISGYVPRKDGLIDGGAVTWVSGLTFEVSAALYSINGVVYSSPTTQITLDAANGTNPRIDEFVLTTSGTAIKITGTAAANPAEPQADPATQLRLTSVSIPAGATAPSGIVNTVVYNENVEWVGSTSGTISAGFNNNTQAVNGSLSTQILSFSSGSTFRWTTTTPVSASTYTTLKFWVRLTANLTNQQNITVEFYKAGVAASTAVQVPLTKNTLNAWQSVTLNISQFAFSQAQFDQIRFQLSGNSANPFFIDYVVLQGGIVQSPGLNTPPLDTANKWVRTILNNVTGDSIIYYIGSTRYAIKDNGSGSVIDTANKWVRTITKNTAGDSLVYYIGSTRYAVKDNGLLPSDTANRWVRLITKNTAGDSLVYFIGASRFAVKDLSGIQPADTANKWITRVYRKTASDSVFYVKGGTPTLAFLDSIGEIWFSTKHFTGAGTELSPIKIKYDSTGTAINMLYIGTDSMLHKAPLPSGSGSTTLQQAIDNGNSFNKNNSIEGNLHSLYVFHLSEGGVYANDTDDNFTAIEFDGSQLLTQMRSTNFSTGKEFALQVTPTAVMVKDKDGVQKNVVTSVNGQLANDTGNVVISTGGGGNNLGAGAQIFKDVTSNNLNLRSLSQAYGVLVTQNTNDISIGLDTFKHKYFGWGLVAVNDSTVRVDSTLVASLWALNDTARAIRADMGSGGGGVSLANPTGTIGLTAVNGSASTAMRSDAAPVLSQAIVPTWSERHTWWPVKTAPGGSAVLLTNAYFRGTFTPAVTSDTLAGIVVEPTLNGTAIKYSILARGYDAKINGVVVGHGNNNNDASFNTVVGGGLIGSNQTGASGAGNSLYGYDAGKALTTGNNNTISGYNAGATLTTGNQNTGMGVNFMFSTSTGVGENTGMGWAALGQITGSQNVGIGVSAGRSFVSGNVAIGYNAGFVAGSSYSNRLFIDNSGTANPLIGGDFSTNQAGINRGYYGAQWHLPAGTGVAGTAPQKFTYESIATTAVSGNGSGIITVTYASQSGPPFAIGSTVVLAGITPSGYNGTGTVTACTSTQVTVSIVGNTTTGSQTVSGTVTQGQLLTTPEAGAHEYDGTNLYITDKTATRYTLVRMAYGTAAPATTPTANGDMFLDTTNKKLYVATGTSSSADWTILN